MTSLSSYPADDVTSLASLSSSASTGSISLPTPSSSSSDVIVTTTAMSSMMSSLFQFQKSIPYVYTTVGFVGMTTNLFVMVVIAKSVPLKKRIENGLIFNQSLIDCLSGFFMILTLTTVQNNAYYSGTWGDFICRFWVPATPLWAGLQASIFSLVVITIERYLEVVHPITYKAKRGIKAVWIMVLIPWILAVVVSVHVIVFKNGVSTSGQCVPGTAWPNYNAMLANGILNIWLKFLIPVPVFIYCYAHMFYAIRQSALKSAASSTAAAMVTSLNAANRGKNKTTVTSAMERARRNVIKTLLYVTVAHIVCLTPNQALYLTSNIFGAYISRTEPTYVMSVVIVYVQCCINPVIYVTCYSAFKRELRKKLSCGNSHSHGGKAHRVSPFDK